jgi:hypothetical protein
MPNFMKIDAGVEVVLRFGLRNLSIANGNDFLIMPLRWALVS